MGLTNCTTLGKGSLRFTQKGSMRSSATLSFLAFRGLFAHIAEGCCATAHTAPAGSTKEKDTLYSWTASSPATSHSLLLLTPPVHSCIFPMLPQLSPPVALAVGPQLPDLL